MATISIDFNSEKNEIYLVGDIDQLRKNRFAWRFAKDYLHPSEEEARIVIPINDEEAFLVLSRVQSMLNKYGFDEKQTITSERVLLDFYEEERRFKEFSDKA